MVKIEEFRKNVIKTYGEIHGGVEDLTGFETEMCFHGTQRPIEFFSAWEVIMANYIPDSKEVSFLEIGAAKGLWSIAFIEFCKLYDKIPTYVTVSLLEGPKLTGTDVLWNPTLINVENYYKDYCKWVHFDKNSQEDETRDLVVNVLENYDFVFIDAEHSYNEVYHDTRLYKPLAKKLLIYHGIEFPYTNTVVAAINAHNIELNHKITCPNSGEGIGIHIIK